MRRGATAASARLAGRSTLYGWRHKDGPILVRRYLDADGAAAPQDREAVMELEGSAQLHWRILPE
jgi:hypothetical protein